MEGLMWTLVILLAGTGVASSGRDIPGSYYSGPHMRGAAPRPMCAPGAGDASAAAEAKLNRINTKQRLQDLRIAMQRAELVRGRQLDAYIIPSDDEHQSESVASRDQRRQFVSGFRGSEAELVVTRDAAVLWTSPVHLRRADAETACYWHIMQTGFPKVPSISEWLIEHLKGKTKARVGSDPRLIPFNTWIKLESDLAKGNISLVAVQSNLVDYIWTLGRPLYPRNSTFVHDIKYAGETWQSKVVRVRAALAELGAQAQVVTALDEVAWLLNLRGGPVPQLPVPRAYVLLGAERLSLYIQGGPSELAEHVRRHLRADSCFDSFCVTVHNYDQIWTDLKTKSHTWKRILVPGQHTFHRGASYAIYSAVNPEQRFVHVSPILLMKAIKNPVEAASMRSAHIRDAAALCHFMAYLELKFNEGERLNESEVASSLDHFRYDQPLNQGSSFPTIVGFGPHGAIPHYRPRPASALEVGDTSTFVIDSGGQYLDGTTDVARTFHFGEPTALQREAYTRILAGQLATSRLVLPLGVPLNAVDVVSRAPLWAAGLDFPHATGHGVGAFLAVHEAPLSIHYNIKDDTTFQVGQFFSNEPAFYMNDKFGIRLENVLEVVQAKTKRQLLNLYNARVRREVGPELKKNVDLQGFRWMMNKTGYWPEWTPPVVRSLSPSRSPHWPLFLLLFTLLHGLLQGHMGWD